MHSGEDNKPCGYEDTEVGASMKGFLRNVAKHTYYKAYPVLSTVWSLIRYVEVFWFYPWILTLPHPLAWKIFKLRAPWLFFRPSEKKRISDNLTHVLETRMSRNRAVLVARRHALFMSSIRFDTQFILSCPPRKVDRTVRFEGLSHVDAVLEQRKGVLLLGCHTGHFYRTIFASARRGYKLHVITMRPEDARQGLWEDKTGSTLYQKLVKKMEEEPNIRIEYVGGSLREVPRALNRGEVVAATLDVPLARGDHRAVKIEFLGRECYFSAQLIRLATRLNAVCLPYVARVDGGLCWLEVFPPRTVADTPAVDVTEVEKEMMYIFGRLEEHILAHPEQWWLWNNLDRFAVPSRDMQNHDL